MQTGGMNFLRWMRVPGDVLFATGAAILGWFVIGLITGHSYDKNQLETAKEEGSKKLTFAN
jgi:nitric oxide reductase subunit B